MMDGNMLSKIYARGARVIIDSIMYPKGIEIQIDRPGSHQKLTVQWNEFQMLQAEDPNFVSKFIMKMLDEPKEAKSEDGD